MELPVTPVIETVASLEASRCDVYAFHDPRVLGTHLNLLVRAATASAAYDAACRVRSEIDRLDRVFNWRDAASEISRLNRSAVHQASAELFAVAQAAEQWRALSGGAVSGRLGGLRGLAGGEDRARRANEIAWARVRMNAQARTIVRPDSVEFDLDAFAKGYIIDRATEAAMTDAAGVSGVMVDIGGDLRCAGEGPQDGCWLIGLPEPLSRYDNAPVRGAFLIGEGAVATSGCGPRDIGGNGVAASATLDPRTGLSVAHRRSASVVAASAMEADALATAMLVGGEPAAQPLMNLMPGATGRITRPDGVDWLMGEQPPLAQWIDYDEPQQGGAQPEYRSGWEDGWIASVTFSAPPKQMRRSIAFRSPYVAIWVSDAERRTVRTLLLIGRIKEWQEFNHVWWRLNRGRTDELLNGRSMSTRGTGEYKIYWDGIDDEGRPVKPGKYTIHVETSRERGEHTHRMLDLDFSTMRVFDAGLPLDAEAGGLNVSFHRY